MTMPHRSAAVFSLRGALFVLIALFALAAAQGEAPTCDGDGCTCKSRGSRYSSRAYDCACMDGQPCTCENGGNCYCNRATTCECNGNNCFCDDAGVCTGTNIMFCKPGTKRGDPNCNQINDVGPQPYCVSDPETNMPSCIVNTRTNESVRLDDKTYVLPYKCISQYFCANSTAINIRNHPEYIVAPVMVAVYLLAVSFTVCCLMPKCRMANRVRVSAPNPDRDLAMEDYVATSWGSYMYIAYVVILFVISGVLFFISPVTWPYGFIPLFIAMWFLFFVGKFEITLRPSKNEFVARSYYCFCIPFLRYRDSLDNLSEARTRWTYVRTKHGGLRRSDLHMTITRKVGHVINMNLGQCPCLDNETNFGQLHKQITRYNWTAEQRAHPELIAISAPDPVDPAVVAYTNALMRVHPGQTLSQRDAVLQTLAAQRAAQAQMYAGGGVGVHPNGYAPAQPVHVITSFGGAAGAGIPHMQHPEHHQGHHPGGPVRAPGLAEAPPSYSSVELAPRSEVAPVGPNLTPNGGEAQFGAVNFCNQCGARQTPGARFCAQCGHSNAQS